MRMDSGLPALLVVDDDLLLQRTLVRVLSGGMCVFAVKNGLEALQVIRAGARFDAILCDIRMPVMSGVQLFRELEELAPAQAERMVFMSASLYAPTAERFLREVENERIEKPLDLTLLRRVLCAARGRSRPNVELPDLDRPVLEPLA
jgi:CheY-like chemotaxis protein